MSRKADVAVLVGSLRHDSLNRKLAHALMALAPEGLDFETQEIGDLPLYTPDLEGDGLPEAWARFRAGIAGAQAVLFVTPEYNRSVPGALKNALDIGSRPSGHSVWNGKPAAVVSGSTGAIGGFGANHALRQSLVYLNMPVMPLPEAYVGNLGSLFDANGALARDDTRAFLASFMQAFAAWIERFAPPSAP